MTQSTHIFVNQLVDGFPELRSLHDEHLGANDELLPHVFFGELTQWLVKAYGASPDGGPDETWRRILDRLEQAYEIGDTDLKELLYVSFLENLPYPDDEGSGITERLGRLLAADLSELR